MSFGGRGNGFSGGGGTGGGGSDMYNGPSPSTVTINDIPAGTNLLVYTNSQLLGNQYAPYVHPSFASFDISGQSTQVEVGTTISGSKSFEFSFNQPGNVTANTLAILDVTGSSTLASGQSTTSPVAANVGTVQLTSPGNYSWRGRATNTQAAQFFSSDFTVSWYWRIYYGISASATLNETQIEALASNALASGFGGIYNFGATNYKFFTWPDSFGSPTAGTGFKDNSTGLALSMADSSDDAFFSNTQNGWSYGLVAVTNTNGITTNYRVYRTKFQLGGTLQALVG